MKLIHLILILTIVSGFVSVYGQKSKTSNPKILKQSKPNLQKSLNDASSVIILNEDNFVRLHGTINKKTTAKFIDDVSNLESNDIYIHMATPGGSVIHGAQIISMIDALTENGKNIHCIADFSASMGFVILQACPNRLIRSNSILMQHQMSTGMKGPLEQIRSRLQFTNQLEEEMETLQCERLNMSRDEFHSLIINDWWIYGKNALEKNVVDEMVNVLCSHHLSGQYYSETHHTMFGSFDLRFSRCPLIWDPIDITIHESADYNKVMNYINQHHDEYYLSESKLICQL
jgi:ATP-dependent protease ClpP protease subunit